MNVYDIYAKLGLDSSEYDKGLANAKTSANTFGGVFSKIGGMVATAAKVGATAIGTASTAIAGLGVASVKSYAEYEQLVGGVQKLYGNMGMNLEDYAKSVGKTTDEVRNDWQNLDKAQNLVLENAKNAYKTAGMSANQYMNTATSFSASLIKSLGGDTVKAAEQTDVAMKAISDNFNTFGGDIGMIQGAFMGFAKQNYTLLDNLKLGYGGSKTQMENLIKDANEYAKSIGQASDLSIDSFSDIVTAIDLIQQKQQIAGTTMREAMTTIEGSANATKAAWENVVTAIASGEGLSDAIQGLISSIFGEGEGTGLLNQIIPRIQQAMEGIGEFIGTAAPFITEKVPELVEAIVPSAISGGVQLLGAIGQGISESIPTLLGVVNDLANQVITSLVEFDWVGSSSGLAEKISGLFDPSTQENLALQLISNALAIIENLATGLGQAAPNLIPAAVNVITNFANYLANQIPTLIDSAFDLILGLAEGLTNPDSLSNMVDSAITLITKLTEGLINNIPKLLQAVPKIVANLVDALAINAPKLIVAAFKLIFQLQKGIMDNIPMIIEAGIKLVGELARGIIDLKSNLWDAAVEIIESFQEGIESFNPVEWGRDLIDSFVRGITSAIGRVREAVSNVANTVRSYLHFSVPDVGPLADFSNYAPDMMALFAKGIKDNEDVVKNQINRSFDFENAIVNATPVTSVQGTSNIGGLNQILNILNSYLPQIANMKMVTDTGMLVGALAPAMNTELGSIKTRSDKR